MTQPSPLDDDSYRGLRRKLVCFFERRRCSCPEDLADETIRRLFVSISRESLENLPAWAYGIAHKVYLEWCRREVALATGPATEQPAASSSRGVDEARSRAQAAVESLDPGSAISLKNITSTTSMRPRWERNGICQRPACAPKYAG